MLMLSVVLGLNRITFWSWDTNSKLSLGTQLIRWMIYQIRQINMNDGLIKYIDFHILLFP